ncbi:hypothetical protein D3C76_1478730 [compost metagenome]
MGKRDFFILGLPRHNLVKERLSGGGIGDRVTVQIIDIAPDRGNGDLLLGLAVLHGRQLLPLHKLEKGQLHDQERKQQESTEKEHIDPDGKVGPFGPLPFFLILFRLIREKAVHGS